MLLLLFWENWFKQLDELSGILKLQIPTLSLKVEFLQWEKGGRKGIYSRIPWELQYWPFPLLAFETSILLILLPYKEQLLKVYIIWKFVLRSLHTLFSSLWETQNRSQEKLYLSGEEDEPINSFALQWRALPVIGNKTILVSTSLLIKRAKGLNVWNNQYEK